MYDCPQLDFPQVDVLLYLLRRVINVSVIRVNKTKNYTVLSNYHFKEKGMSLKAKGLLSLMLSLPDDWNYSVSGLVKLSKDGKDSVMSALSELEKFGYLIRTRVQNEKGQFSGVEYYIYEQPQGDNPMAENPISGKEEAEKPPAGIPQQLNTNKLNNKENKLLYDINNYIDILDNIKNDRLRNLYCDFIHARFEMNAPIGRNGLLLLIERVRELVGLDIEKQQELIKLALINGWKNVYLPASQDQKSSEEINELKKYYDI